MSTKMTQKIYKVYTSGLQAFSSHSYSRGPGTCISSSAFSPIASVYRVGLSTNMSLARGYSGAGSMGGIIAVQVNQSLLSPLKLVEDLKNKISEVNQNISKLQAEIEGLKGQIASLEAAFAAAQQCGELAIKDAQAGVAELEASLRTTKQDMAQQLHEYQELMNVKLALGMETATY
uniref:Keratin, type II cytoskeletal 8 n=1 Tax=Molossus molossus TaxID=27622 RepID=A0A7J8ER98_MOLMO|nr:hypothetical protein HJG59_008661 [Molossus molossus]